jgi:hypothetical protein
LLPPFVYTLLQFFWLPVLLLVLGLAAFWRLQARPRIAADPSLRLPLNRLYGGFAFWLALPVAFMGAGILAGAVPHVLHFLRFDPGSPFVVAFWLLVVVEDALLLWWVFRRGGDERIALHAELPQHRPQVRLGARVLAVAAPLSQAFALAYATFSPQLGQFLGA